MLPLKKKRSRIITDEQNAITNYGTTFVLLNHDGVTACTVCHLDTTYNSSTDPLCSTCGGSYWIPAVSCHTITGIISHIDGSELDLTKIGGLEIGDYKVKIMYTDLAYCENALNNRVAFNVDGSSMTIYKITPTVLKTSLNVFMKKSDKQDEVAIR